VSDDGRGAKAPPPGLGTQLVDALATELDGFVGRRFTQSGPTVTLSFFKDNAGVSTYLMHPHLADGFRVKSASRGRTRTDPQGPVHPHPAAVTRRKKIRNSLNPASAKP